MREALFRLELEGYVKVAFRSGWSVAPFDFRRLEELYDLPIVLECTAVDRLCAMVPMPELGLLSRSRRASPPPTTSTPRSCVRCWRAEPAKLLLRTHIEASKAEVRKITIHKLHSARPAAGTL